MSNTNHIDLGEFGENDTMYSLSMRARDLLQFKSRVFTTYESFKQKLYGFPTEKFSDLLDIKKESFFLRCEQQFLNDRKYKRESKRDRLSSTPVKRNTNVSNLQQKHLQFDNTGNEVSQTVSKGLEKQSTSGKIFPDVSKPENSPKENTPSLAVVSDVSPTFSKNPRKQPTPVKVNRNTSEFENLSSKRLPASVVHKAESNAEPVNLDSSISGMDGPIMNLSTGKCPKFISPIAKDCTTLSKTEKEKPENSSEGVIVHGFPSTDVGNITKVKATSTEQKTSMKESRNVTEPDSLRTKHLPLCRKEIKTPEPLNLESNIPVRRQKVLYNPEIGTVLDLSTKIEKEYVNPISKDQEVVGKMESDKEEPEKSDDVVKISSMSTEKVKKNLSPFNDVRVDGVSNIDGGNNSRPLEKVTESNNRKSFDLTGQSTSKGKIEEFSLAKKLEISNNSASKYQESLCSDNKARKLEHSYQDSEKNISPSHAINIFRNCERKRKSPSPRKTTVKCSSKPKIIHLSGPVEVETGICIESTENPGLNASPISLIECKSVEMIKTNKEEFSGNKTKPGISRDIIASTKKSITCSPPVVRDDVIDLEKDRHIIDLTGQSTSKGKIEEFSLAKKLEISNNSASEYQESLCSDNKARKLEHSYQDSEKNISPSHAINIFRNCERKRKSPSPSKTTVKCSSKPRTIHLSGPVEVETGICIESTENPSLKASPISLIECKSVEMIKTNKEEFSGNKTKPGISRDISASTKESITCSPPVVRDDVIDLGKDRLCNKFLKTVPLNACGSATLSSPGIESKDSEILMHCITQFQNLLTKREECLKYIYTALQYLQHNLKILYDYVESLIYFLNEICINAEWISKMLQDKASELFSSALKLVKNLVALRIDVTIVTQYFTANLQRISKIASRYEPLLSNGKPLVNFDSLQAYEQYLKTVWHRLDKQIKFADGKRLYFLNTEKDFLKVINVFTECLFMIGILKTCPPPML